MEVIWYQVMGIVGRIKYKLIIVLIIILILGLEIMLLFNCNVIIIISWIFMYVNSLHFWMILKKMRKVKYIKINILVYHKIV